MRFAASALASALLAFTAGTAMAEAATPTLRPACAAALNSHGAFNPCSTLDVTHVETAN